MTKLFLWINSILLLIASGGAYYIIFRTNPTEVPIPLVWALLVCILIIVWSITAYLSYTMRLFLSHNLFKNRDTSYILLRSQRQGLLLGILFGLQLALQGFLLFNILSATILTIAVFLLEFLFIAQENK
ncbi:hypothetical protein EBU71_03045 [bacterium]|nr:hypothetical protein [Candidatus Elulimicrobium humile]